MQRTFTYGDLRDSPEKGKGARRRVPLRSRVVEALREAGKVGPGVDPDALLFPDSEGAMLDLQSFRRNWWNVAVATRSCAAI